MGVETLDAVADRGYYTSEEILACEEAGITVTLPKPNDLELKSGRALRQAGLPLRGSGGCLRLSCRTKACIFLHDILRRYRTNACQYCAIKHSCTTGKERLISRWEHEAVLETVQARLDQHPEKMTIRCQTAEHPFGTFKCCMGATHSGRIWGGQGTILRRLVLRDRKTSVALRYVPIRSPFHTAWAKS